MASGSPLFEEKQRFRQTWLWVVLLAVNALFLYGIYAQIFNEGAFGNNPVSDPTLWGLSGSMLFLTLFFLLIRLETLIKEDGIYVRFFPIHLKFKKYAWEEIAKCYVRTYKPLMEYGGWGFRIGLFGSGGALNVSGKEGVQLELESGKKLLIGTQRPEEAKGALQELGKASDPDQNKSFTTPTP